MERQIARIFARKPLYVNAVQVTVANMNEVADWCKGQIVSTFLGPERISTDYIQVNVKKIDRPRQAQAFIGDWVLLSTTGFKVYLDKAFRGSFEVLQEKPCGDAMTTADGMPCVLGEGHKNMEYPIGCRSLLDYKELEEKTYKGYVNR